MFTPGKIWIILLAILSLSTILTAYCWYSSPLPSLDPSFNESPNASPRFDISLQKKMIRALMAEYKKTKTDLIVLKSEKSAFLVQQTNEKNGNFIVNYLADNDSIVIREVYLNSSISEIHYDVNRDDKIDCIEYFGANVTYPKIRKLDTNGDELFDIQEDDKNHDGIIDTSELQINIDGMLIPFSTFSMIIM